MYEYSSSLCPSFCSAPLPPPHLRAHFFPLSLVHLSASLTCPEGNEGSAKALVLLRPQQLDSVEEVRRERSLLEWRGLVLTQLYLDACAKSSKKRDKTNTTVDNKRGAGVEDGDEGGVRQRTRDCRVTYAVLSSQKVHMILKSSAFYILPGGCDQPLLDISPPFWFLGKFCNKKACKQVYLPVRSFLYDVSIVYVNNYSVYT